VTPLTRFWERRVSLRNATKLDMQVARFQSYPRRQVGQLPAECVGLHGDLHARCRPLPAESIDQAVRVTVTVTAAAVAGRWHLSQASLACRPVSG